MSRIESRDRIELMTLVLQYQGAERRNAYFEESAFIEIAQFYRRENHLDDAKEALERGIEQYNYSVDIRLHYADVLAELGQVALALSTLDKAEALAPGDRSIMVMKARITAIMGYDAEALEQLEYAKQDADNRELCSILVEEAAIWQKQRGERHKAFDLLHEALVCDPHHTQAAYELLQVTQYVGRHAEALQIFLKTLEHAPYAYMARFGAANCYEALGDIENALEAYQDTFHTNPKFVYPYLESARLYLEQKNYARALRMYSYYLDQFHANEEVEVNVAKCYLERDNFPTAKSFLTKVLQVNECNEEAFYLMGQCLHREGNYKGAIIAFEKAIEIDEHREEYLIGIAEANYQMGKIQEAKHYFLEAIDIAPDVDETWVRILSFYLENNLFDEALEVLEDAERNYYLSPEILSYQIVIKLAKGDRKTALHELTEVLSESEDAYNYYAEKLLEIKPELNSDREFMAVLATFFP